MSKDDTQIRGSVPNFEQSEVIMRAGAPLPQCQQVGICVDLCLLAQLTSSQDQLQIFRAAAWQVREGANERYFTAPRSKGCLASDKDLSIQLQSCVILFANVTHILKLERDTEDQHRPCTRMTRHFEKRSKFSTISGDHACGDTLAVLPVVRAWPRFMVAGSSCIEPRPPPSILCWTVVVGRRSKRPVVQCYQKQSLPYQ